jgi:hypothetical protein
MPRRRRKSPDPTVKRALAILFCFLLVGGQVSLLITAQASEPFAACAGCHEG